MTFLDRALAGADGDWMYRFASSLYPICRSITGEGVRATLRAIGAHLPLTIHEVPTGTAVLDWTVPREWNVREAWIRGPGGEKIVDFADHNLHLVSYSVPVRARLPLAELRPHLHSLPERPDWIPYRTSYYDENWGFCLPHRQLEALPEGDYEVCIDAALTEGALSYGECLVPGRTSDEVLLSAHVCHPSLANDNLSGIALLTALGRALAAAAPRLSYRLLFAPGTIGSITWLARNRERVGNIRHGVCLSCVGDGAGPYYKRSRQGGAPVDRAFAHVIATRGRGEVADFFPYGYDERQYCSPGFDLPVGLFERSRFGAFPQYHTSADDLSLIASEHLAESYAMVAEALDVLESDRLLVGTKPYGEPQLGRRGLYQAIGGDAEKADRQMAMLWVLNLADGRHTLLDMAERARLPFRIVRETAALLEQHDLLRPA